MIELEKTYISSSMEAQIAYICYCNDYEFQYRCNT